MTLKERKLNLITNIFIFFFFMFSSVHSKANEYFDKKSLSHQNLTFALGTPIFKPIQSFTNTFAKEVIVQMDYRRDYKELYFSSVLRGRMEVDPQARMKVASAFSGLRFPISHRKTPFYFGLLFGVGFSKNSKIQWPVYLKILSAYRVIQWNREASTLIEIGVQYMLRQENWWQRPASISLLAVFDFNI